MANEKQKKINKNNRMRGGAFEKRGADFLDMDVVPYSGSNARFGYGDVRDSIWLGEFKNITPKEDGKVTIKVEWLTKNMERATNIKHIPFLAWMPAGTPHKFVILEYITYKQYFNHEEYVGHIDLEAKHNTKNLIININDGWVKEARKSSIYEIALNGECWFIMSMERFKRLINDNNMKGVRQTDGLY